MQAPKIIFEDTHLLVLDKPAGLLSQGEHSGAENLVDFLRQYLGRPYVGLVHRLDRNTSGIMIVGKRTKSAQRLTESLQAGRIDRLYLAWIEGKLPAGVTRWRHQLVKDQRTNVTRVVSAAKTGAVTGKKVPTLGGPPSRSAAGKPSSKKAEASAKEAVLAVWPEAYGQHGGKELTLAAFRLETGRSHQIRVQAAYEKHPLLGDAKYGSKTEFGRPALHSHRIRFEHPMSREWME